MKQLIILALAVITITTGCRKIEIDGDGGFNPSPVQGEGTVLSGKINSDRTLKTGVTYTLKGIVYVVDGAKLTIEPGVTIQGEKSSRGTLVITRGCQVLANGTETKPVVFTSDATVPQRGDWGGIVICGRAKTNNSFNGVQGVGEVEGGVNNSEGLGLYGGADDNDNSGVLKYVRVEYAGYAYLPDKELNGITFCAVGRGTTVDHVQVSYANDDSFEWFGGAVDCKYLIAYKGLDDDFDTDNGYSGRVQFAIGFRDSLVADISGSNGFESDNDAGGANYANFPQTSPIFSNVTLIGPRAALTNAGNSNYKRGLHLRRNTALSIFNSVIIGWPTGLYLDAGTGTPTDLNITAGRMVLANNIFAGNNTQLGYVPSGSSPTGWSTNSLTNYINGAGNTLLTNADDVQLTSPFNYDNTVDFNPSVGSAALTGSDFTNTKVASWFTSTTYRGACGSGDNWWKNWTSYK